MFPNAVVFTFTGKVVVETVVLMLIESALWSLVDTSSRPFKLLTIFLAALLLLSLNVKVRWKRFSAVPYLLGVIYLGVLIKAVFLPEAKATPVVHPHLNAELVIDSWPKRGIPTIHAIVENIGAVQVDDMRGFYSTPEMVAAELEPAAFPRTLPPKGKLSISIGPVNDLKRNHGLSLDLTYRAQRDDGVNDEFTSHYDFLIPATLSETIGSFQPNGRGESNGDVASKPLLDKLFVQLSQNHGEVLFVLPERRTDGNENILSLTGPQRGVVVNCVSRTAVFYSGSSGPAKVSFGPANVHIVSIRWDDMAKVADLSVDGQSSAR